MLRHPGRGNGVAAGFGQGHVLIPNFRDHRRVSHFPANRARQGGLRAAALNLAGLIEVELDEGPGRVTGVEVKLRPEPVQFLFALFVENQLDERIVIAPEAHDAVIARAQQTSGVG